MPCEHGSHQVPPNWAKQGRRTRRFLAKKTYEDVEDAFYRKGIVRVKILAAVDDSRKVLDVLCSSWHTHR